MTPRETVQVEAFAGCGDRVRYDEYRRVRHQVFVAEQGWTGLTSDAAPGVTIPDPADRCALFWLARNETGAAIGEVRIVALADAFPHKELFADHLRQVEMQNMRSSMGMLNSLAVLPAYRGRQCDVDGEGPCGTVARALLRASLRGSRVHGFSALIATAQNVASARALLGVGFQLIDAPARTALHDHFLMANVGIVLGGRDGACLSRYFDRRQRDLVASRSLETLFEDWTTASQGHRSSRQAACTGASQPAARMTQERPRPARG